MVVALLAAVLAVGGLTAGCRVDRPGAGVTGSTPRPTSPIAVADESPGRPADPLADLDAVLDEVERDLDAATAEG